MSIPEEILRPGEEAMLDTHPHWWFIVPASAALAGAMLFGLVIIVNDPDIRFVGDALKILSGTLVLVALGYFAMRYAKWVSTNFVVTSERVVYRAGVFAKQGLEIPVDKINAVHFSQTVFERLLKLGDLLIESASDAGASEFEDIPHPSAVKEVIYGVMQSKAESGHTLAGEATARALRDAGIGGSAAAGVVGGTAVPVADQLEKLHDLLERGVLSPEEYEAQKARLLS
jgi:membrane protein YdbS with pleckstrin-like domain